MLNYLYASAHDLNSSPDGLVMLKCKSIKEKLGMCAEFELYRFEDVTGFGYIDLIYRIR